MQKKTVIVNFQLIRPQFTTSQQNTLDWLVEAHVKAESIVQRIEPEGLGNFRKSLASRLQHVGCKPSMIARRGHEIPDFTHHDWKAMEVYRLDEDPRGGGLEVRGKIHQQIVERIVGQMYLEAGSPPENMIHVSCTGYASPSALQKIASQKKWGHATQITHAYHMGCYASIPALRLGSAFVHSSGGAADIVHTEVCTLHHNPLQHEPEHLVAQSLFADGFIRYSLKDESAAYRLGEPYLRILGVYEEIVPDTLHNMAWNLSDWGFKFVLTKEIPRLLQNYLRGYLKNLCCKAGVHEADLLNNGIFAIHPGGPRILKNIQQELKAADEQLASSREILMLYGNMSSATLPHIWEKLLRDESIPSGTKILSLAFGPGLNIAGVILEKG